jgi:outer membrane protein TolC
MVEYSARGAVRGMTFWLITATLLVARPGELAGQGTGGDTLRLATAIAAARDGNPMLRAAVLSADAAAERVPQAGALPDPQLSFGLMNRMLWSFGADEPMTMNQVQLSQMLPWPGKLGFGKRRAQHLARAGAFEAVDAELRIVREVKSVYAELAYVDRAIAIMERTRELLRNYFRVSQAMYAAGEAIQQDVLRRPAGAGIRAWRAVDGRGGVGEHDGHLHSFSRVPHDLWIPAAAGVGGPP